MMTFSAQSSDKELFVASPFTEPSSFTDGIEGPACDSDGNVYAVNFEKQHTIGIVTPKGEASIFVNLEKGSVGNGIRFDQKGNMYIADYTNHNVLKVDMKTKKIEVHAHESKMNQPNDIAITKEGIIYASDPNWKESTGQVWRVDLDGTITLVAPDMGTTNGIDVSPDGKTLYVNESVQRNVWSFKINSDGSVSNKKLIHQFKDFGMDGMRCDVDGNIYITRYGKGTVVKMTPQGEILKEIDVLGEKPSNLCFGGPDGCTIYVTEVEHERLVEFRVDQPGLAWKRWQK